MTPSTRPPAPPSTARLRAALRAVGRAALDGLATDNGWWGAYGVWVPTLGVAPTQNSRRSFDSVPRRVS